MKRTVKFLIVIIISMLSIQSFAQSFGVVAGLNLSRLPAKDNDDTYNDHTKMHPGFHIGGTVNTPFSDMFSLEGALLISTKGKNYKDDDIKGSVNLFYIDVPIMFKALFDLGGVGVFGKVGPYVGIGLSGKVKTDIDGDKDSENIKWGSDEDKDDLKRLDFGLAIGAGVEINALQISIGYDLGLANISPYTDDGYKMNNRVFKISFGYRFGK
jgi:outer membrane protein W